MEPLKDQFFHPQFVRSLAAAIGAVHPAFDAAAFARAVLDQDWAGRELKGRMRHISKSLHAHLPMPYPKQARILQKAAPAFTGFSSMVFPDFVECFGLEHPEISLTALELFTTLCSSEYAVRPFLVRYPDQTLERMLGWTRHENHHLRRLASEGCRPRLPWGMALPAFKKDPSPILPILEALRNDPSEYVRRSVANSLNDIAKDNPAVTLSVARRWRGQSRETDALLKHACRTLLKAGDPEALALFGYQKQAVADVSDLRVQPGKVRIGESVAFSFTVRNPGAEPVKLRLEYTVYFSRASGKQGRKVFHIGERLYSPGATRVERRHSFRDLSTRTHYPGEHTLAVSINGMEKARIAILLAAAGPAGR